MLHLVEWSHLVAELLEIGGIDLNADGSLAVLALDLLAILFNEAVTKRLVFGKAFAEDTKVSGGDLPDLVPMGQKRPELVQHYGHLSVFEFFLHSYSPILNQYHRLWRWKNQRFR